MQRVASSSDGIASTSTSSPSMTAVSTIPSTPNGSVSGVSSSTKGKSSSKKGKRAAANHQHQQSQSQRSESEINGNADAAVNGQSSANGEHSDVVKDAVASSSSSSAPQSTSTQQPEASGSSSSSAAQEQQETNLSSKNALEEEPAQGKQVESALLEHIYQRGFLTGEYSDLSLHYSPDRTPFRLHSLIVAQSPTIANLLSHPLVPAGQAARDIFLPLTGMEDVTEEALWLALGYLYSSRSLAHLNAQNAPSVLLAALLLQLSTLASHAGRACLRSIENVVSPQDTKTWIDYLDRIDSRLPAQSNDSDERRWTQELRSALTDRLTSTLPSALNAFSASTPASQQTEAQTILARIYSILPFEMFKSILESPSLGSGTGESLNDQARFGLAKRCIAERKRVANSATGTSNGNSTAASAVDYEETVVLAFGASTAAGASNVNIVRRPKQNRRLWKVAGP